MEKDDRARFLHGADGRGRDAACFTDWIDAQEACADLEAQALAGKGRK